MNWHRVEVFGNTVHYAEVEGVEEFGTNFVRLLTLEPNGLREERKYGPAAIFCISPLEGGETEARKALGMPEPVDLATAPLVVSEDGLRTAACADEEDEEYPTAEQKEILKRYFREQLVRKVGFTVTADAVEVVDGHARVRLGRFTITDNGYSRSSPFKLFDGDRDLGSFGYPNALRCLIEDADGFLARVSVEDGEENVNARFKPRPRREVAIVEMEGYDTESGR